MDYYLQELGGCGCANGGTCPECGPSESTPVLEVKSSISPSKKVAIPVITSPDYYASLVSTNESAAPAKAIKGNTESKITTKPMPKASIIPVKSPTSKAEQKPKPSGFAIATGGFAMMFLIAVVINSD